MKGFSREGGSFTKPATCLKRRAHLHQIQIPIKGSNAKNLYLLSWFACRHWCQTQHGKERPLRVGGVRLLCFIRHILNFLLFECPLCMGLDNLSLFLFFFLLYSLACKALGVGFVIELVLPSKNWSLKRTKTGPSCKRPTHMPYPTWGAFLHMVCETFLSKSTPFMTFSLLIFQINTTLLKLSLRGNLLPPYVTWHFFFCFF